MDALCEKLLQVSKDGVLHYTLDEGKILNANQGLMKTLDIDGTPESLHGKLIKTANLDLKTKKNLNTQLLKKKEIHNFEYLFKTSNNKGKWLNLNTHIIDGPSLKDKTVLAIVKDITKQKKLKNEHVKLKRTLENEKIDLLKVAKEIEEELKKSEQKYKSLVERAGAGMATSDSCQTIVNRR